MQDVSLSQVAWLLAAAALAAPLAKWLRIGTVLGYLMAGIVIGPFGIGRAFETETAEAILHVAEFGVVMLLFLIGLELRPRRLWALRASIFGIGGAQVLVTGALLAAVGVAAGLKPAPALFIGLALSLSSTAFALQVLEEKGELNLRHGRLAFAILLFQDLAAIPLIALVPLFSITAAGSAKMDIWAAAQALGTIAAVVVVGHFVLDHILRLIARTQVKEAMTAAALLTVIGVAIVMQKAGLSASLGSFLAGALLAESTYRHQLEADIKPFEGLLLGFFFTAIGMTLDLRLLVQHPGLILLLAFILLLIKACVLYGLGRWQGLSDAGARRLALAIPQGGEFAFVLFTAGVAAGVMSQEDADVLAVVVTLSMAATPPLLLLDEGMARLRPKPKPAYDDLPENEGHVIIAGFGRFGQIIARVLLAKRIPLTALDINAEQIALVRRFGSKAFYGDASRPEILEAAQAGKARAFVLAIDDVQASLVTAQTVRQYYPNLPIYARARDRIHVHRLMDLGIRVIRRETLLSALDITREVLRGLGYSERDVRFAVDTFAKQDQKRLVDDYTHYSDVEKLQERARSDAEELERILDDDAVDQATQAGEASRLKRAKTVAAAKGGKPDEPIQNKESAA